MMTKGAATMTRGGSMVTKGCHDDSMGMVHWLNAKV